MRRLIAILLSLTGGSAVAHPGHIADVAGHGHWVGAAAIGLAILVGLLGKKRKDTDLAEDADEPEADEAPA